MEPIGLSISYKDQNGIAYVDRYDLDPDHVLKETTVLPSKTDNEIKLQHHQLAAIQAVVSLLNAH